MSSGMNNVEKAHNPIKHAELYTCCDTYNAERLHGKYLFCELYKCHENRFSSDSKF